MAEQLGAEEAAGVLSSQRIDKNKCHASSLPTCYCPFGTHARMHTRAPRRHIRETGWEMLRSSCRQTCHRSNWHFLLIISAEWPVTGGVLGTGERHVPQEVSATLAPRCHTA